jgi:hypothetical protein
MLPDAIDINQTKGIMLYPRFFLVIDHKEIIIPRETRIIDKKFNSYI